MPAKKLSITWEVWKEVSRGGRPWSPEAVEADMAALMLETLEHGARPSINKLIQRWGWGVVNANAYLREHFPDAFLFLTGQAATLEPKPKPKPKRRRRSKPKAAAE